MAEPMNDRGFLGYTDIDTTYGNRVRVYESSAASGPHVWLRIQPNGPNPLGEARGEGTAHLDVAQARAIIAGLTEWLDGIPERWTDGEKFLTEENPNDHG